MPKKSNKKIWFVVEDIPQNTHFMMSVPTQAFITEWPKRGLGNKITRYFRCLKKIFRKCVMSVKNLTPKLNFWPIKCLNNLLGRCEFCRRLKSIP